MDGGEVLMISIWKIRNDDIDKLTYDKLYQKYIAYTELKLEEKYREKIDGTKFCSLLVMQKWVGNHYFGLEIAQPMPIPCNGTKLSDIINQYLPDPQNQLRDHTTEFSIVLALSFLVNLVLGSFLIVVIVKGKSIGNLGNDEYDLDIRTINEHYETGSED